jgi:CheY-like chemotaxis protein
MDKMLRRLVGDDVTLSLRLPSTPCKAVIDPTQVEQIVMNLVVNARDAMPRGGALTVELTTVDLPAGEAHEPDLPGGPFVRLTVSDTGVGISPELRERIFEPFFTTKDATRGTGLGLSTVYGIVEQSGGRVSVESEVGATTFTVLLPRTEQLADAPAVAAPAPASLRGTETVLVVEDDEAVRMVTCTILRRQGYTVLDAQNGGEALLISEVTAAPIHLLLTDLVMPRMRGVDLARRLGAARPDMQVVFMSGDARGSPLDRAITEPPASFVEAHHAAGPVAQGARGPRDAAVSLTRYAASLPVSASARNASACSSESTVTS